MSVIPVFIYMTDQFWQCQFFPFFSVQVVFEFVSVGKTLVEMLYGYVYDIIFC